MLSVSAALSFAFCVHVAHGAIGSLIGAGSSSFPSAAVIEQLGANSKNVGFNTTNSSVSVFPNLYVGSTVRYDAPPGDNPVDAVARLAARSIQFIGTDIALNASQLSTLSAASGNVAALHIPHLLTSMVVAYNIPGFSNVAGNPPLNFTADLLARIFKRQVLFWNDSSLLAINPAFQASSVNRNAAFTLVVRSDPSSTTLELTDYMNRFSPSQWTSAPSLTANWPSGFILTTNGSDMAKSISGNAYSLGYAKKRSAQNGGLTMAALQTKFGTFVLPTDAALQEAADTTALPRASDNTWSSLSMGNFTTSPIAYPATHFSYFVVYPYTTNLAFWGQTTAQLVADFLLFVNSDYGQSLLPSGYVKLSKALFKRNAETITQFMNKPQPTPQPNSAMTFFVKGQSTTMVATVMALTMAVALLF